MATGLLLAALAATLAYVASRVDPAALARLAAQKVQAQTGRELHIDGPVGFSISWAPTLFAEGVRFQNAAWGSRPDMARVRRVEVTLALRPLLQGEVDILRVRLVEPDILLETDAQGHGNWVLSRPAAPAPPAAAEPAGLSLRLHDAELQAGVLTYRHGRDPRARRLEVPALKAKVSGDFTRVSAAGRGRYEATDVEFEATLDRSAPAAAALTLSLKAAGATVVATTALDGGARTPPVRLAVEVTDWATVARLAGTTPPTLPALPALKAEGRVSVEADRIVVEGLKATLGRSSFAGQVRIGLGRPVPHVDADLDVPVLDLAELLGPPPPPEPAAAATGSLFSSAPLPVGALRAVDGRVHARVAHLVLRDGRVLERLDVRAAADKGHVVADWVRVQLEGKVLQGQARLDGSNGKTLGVDLSVSGRGIALGALARLLQLPAMPLGSTVDIDIRFRGQGLSQRELLAGADADVQLVVGPGRLHNRAIDWGADITELLDGINPAHRSDPYTELKCAVLRLPVRQGVARIDNSVAAQTSKVQILVAGVVDLRHETLDIGLRSKAATGLGIGLGDLAGLARLRGSLSQPTVQLDKGAAALSAAKLWLAGATGGVSLLVGGLLTDRFPASACQAALATAPPPPAPP